MDYKLDKLDNGLKVLSVEMPTLESATLTVWVKVGARYESDKKAGLSHFLEHMAFKGSKKYPTVQKVAEHLDGLGAVYNASTSYEWTSFYVKVRSAMIEKAFDVISDMVKSPILRKPDLERERGVILEEIAMHDDTPSSKIGKIFGNLIFSGNPLGRDVSGTKKSVENIQIKDIESYRNRHYKAGNMMVAVAGGLKRKRTLGLSKKYSGTLDKGKTGNPVKFASTQKKPKLVLEEREGKQAHVILGYLGYPHDHKEKYVETVLSTILGGGMSSRLFSEVREKRGLAYSVSTAISRYSDTGIFASYAGVDPAKIDETIKVMLDQINGIKEKKYPIEKKELNRVKEYIKGGSALSLEDTSAVNGFFSRQVLFNKKVRIPEEAFKEIDSVTVEDIYRVAKDLFVSEKLNMGILGPYKDRVRFEKLLC